MRQPRRSGVYAIEHMPAHRLYIGSSADIDHRWYAHRRALRNGTHQAAHLQHAWTKYGVEAFEFYVIEECGSDRAVLLAREQEYLDAFRPVFNNCIRAGSRLGSKNTDNTRVRAGARRRGDRTTHCPRGHEYTPENTLLTKRNQRVCKRCAADKVMAKYTPKTPFTLDGPVCKRGHEWTPENTITLKRGTRQCRACKDQRRESRNARNRARYQSNPEFRERSRLDYERHKTERLAKDKARRDRRRATLSVIAAPAG